MDAWVRIFHIFLRLWWSSKKLFGETIESLRSLDFWRTAFCHPWSQSWWMPQNASQALLRSSFERILIWNLRISIGKKFSCWKGASTGFHQIPAQRFLWINDAAFYHYLFSILRMILIKIVQQRISRFEQDACSKSLQRIIYTSD
jgi:hypothetical protein